MRGTLHSSKPSTMYETGSGLVVSAHTQFIGFARPGSSGGYSWNK